MPDFDSWLGESKLSPASAETRAVLCWNRIQDRPTSITIKRGTSTLSSQTVRIEYGEVADPLRSEGISQAGVRDVWVIGVSGHPDETIIDTDIAARDLFALDWQTYTVVDVIRVPGEVQARCERTA